MIKTMQILTSDIGGTNSRFGHFSLSEDQNLQLVQTKWLKTSEASEFAELLHQLERSDFALRLEDADIVVFAVAGHVERGVSVRLPQVSWEIDLGIARSEFGIGRFALINDFLAQAFACQSPLAANAVEILSGVAVPESPIAVIGAGTGLGKAVLVPGGPGCYVGAASEGGHSNFCPESVEEFAFQQWLSERLGRRYLAWYEVVSGPGLSRIHEFLTGDKLSPEEVAETFDYQSTTLRWASRMFGRVARNYCLEVLARGGLYIVGGVAAKNPVLISHPAFSEAFCDAYVHRSILQLIPVRIIDDEASGLWGAAYYGLNELNR